MESVSRPSSNHLTWHQANDTVSYLKRNVISLAHAGSVLMVATLVSFVVFVTCFYIGLGRHLEYPKPNPYAFPMWLSFFGSGYLGLLGQGIFK